LRLTSTTPVPDQPTTLGVVPLTREAPYTDQQLQEFGLVRTHLPRHVAVIMDGNGRWAQRRGLPRIEGHRRGVQSVRCMVEEASRMGLEQLTLYCFSSENWKRPPRELTLLMALLRQYLIEERREIQRQGLRFRVIGTISELDPAIQQEIARTEQVAAGNDGMTLCLAVNYGARQEITAAVQAIAAAVKSGQLQPADISQQTISNHLTTAGMPDPDLVIRTAGELRVSNFLLWQISYAELWVSTRFWPEFREDDFRQALRDFAARDRRFGGLSAKPAAT
jgi:undecaprenyl diphosphate synthase